MFSHPSNPPLSETEIQRQYYATTAEEYDAVHVDSTNEPEHDIALSFLCGMANYHDFTSFLDVGAGTGRAMLALRSAFPDATVAGIEPVAALRSVAVRKGVDSATLTDGDAAALPFPDGSFDVATMFGVLHHVKDPTACIEELFRVSRRAIFLSDLNNFGCGGFPQRVISQALNAIGLWQAAQFISTGGKMYKMSEGDGLAYSYSLYNDLPLIRAKSTNVYLMNTRDKGGRPYRDCSHVALLATK